MPDKIYQVLARRYRPQTFAEVLGQAPIVTTLKNAIQQNRVAHAYLFCGSRGTGKTTLARLFAKALNCKNRTETLEPCNNCSSCKEITRSCSMDVLEIDGASNRGIDDIRQINETVGFVATSSEYKIFIIDEVHMLTKEAFNALLKTLEEPPPKVKFLFATTEPHKLLPTIVSRCQRFQLQRIPALIITEKLQRIAQDLNLTVAPEVFSMIAAASAGGLRDAESLFDQVISFSNGSVTIDAVNEILGVMSKDVLFQLDEAMAADRLAFAFELSGAIYSAGKEMSHFVEELLTHYRHLLYLKTTGTLDCAELFSQEEEQRYQQSAAQYTQEQCLYILDLLVNTQNTMKHTASSRITLELALLNIIRSHKRVSITTLIHHLDQLQQKDPQQLPLPLPEKPPAPIPTTPPPPPKKEVVAATAPPPPKKMETPTSPPPQEDCLEKKKQQSHHDTVLQFAAVELEGSISTP